MLASVHQLHPLHTNRSLSTRQTTQVFRMRISIIGHASRRWEGMSRKQGKRAAK